jgi:sugar lactone lactonase YvrE
MRFLVPALVTILGGGAAHGAIVYGANSTDPFNLYTVNPFTGATNLIGAMGVNMFDIAFGTASGLYGISGGPTSSLYTINRTTGTATLVGSTGVFVNALVFAPNGTLYAAGNSSFYSINIATGAATLIGNDAGTNPYTSAGDLEFDGSGNLYLTSTAGTNNRLYRINTATGDGARLPNNIGFNNVYGLAYVNNTMYGFTTAGRVITINLTTGVGTGGATYGFAFNGTAVDPAPEPATFVLVSLALAGVGALRARRRYG